MTLSDLGKWRKRAPFIIFGFCILPYYLINSKTLEQVKLASEITVPALALFCAYFYVGCGLRRSAWANEIHTHVGKQIRDALLAMAPNDLNITEEERRALDREAFKELTGVFWEAVEHSKLLQSQKEHFYSNGIVYSTSIDVFLICLFIGLFYWVACLITRTAAFAYAGGFLVALSLASKFLVTPSRRKRHVLLSSEQLEVLCRDEREFVTERFRQIILGWRRKQMLAQR